MLHWIFHWTGLDDGSGAPYLFWSGICGDLVFVGAFYTAYRHLQCHVGSCRRLGLHPVHGTSFKVCKTHHPTGGHTAEQIYAAHKQAQPKSRMYKPDL